MGWFNLQSWLLLSTLVFASTVRGYRENTLEPRKVLTSLLLPANKRSHTHQHNSFWSNALSLFITPLSLFSSHLSLSNYNVNDDDKDNG